MRTLWWITFKNNKKFVVDNFEKKNKKIVVDNFENSEKFVVNNFSE